jgi:hypothetical protein
MIGSLKYGIGRFPPKIVRHDAERITASLRDPAKVAGARHEMLKILSGGQTGVDRAALDAAIERGLPYGGWCPKGGWAEDLPNPPGLLALYAGLRETADVEPRQRTEWNVRDSDRLMVLLDRYGLSVSKGTEFALDCADSMGRPYLVVDLAERDAVAQAGSWLCDQQGSLTLCIAGPRESEAPGIYAKAREFLRPVLSGDDRA